MTTKTIINVVVTTIGVTLYDSEGNTHNLSGKDSRALAISDAFAAAKKAGTLPIVVDLTTYSVLSRIEKDSGGLIRFFRIAKNKIKGLLGQAAEKPKTPNQTGWHDEIKPETPVLVQPETPPVTPEILQKLEEASSEDLSPETSTVVAVINDTPIVGAEALLPHAEAAVSMGDTVGFQKMMERLGAVAAKRKHTAQEALKFLEGMDLPFALDGSIVAYKSLSKTEVEGVFIDNHSRTLKQGLGTLVQMDVELVDDNRRTLCSNGLHVARQGYLRGYGTGDGNVITLIKINPEDIISVPLYESSKMRVRAYHIVAVLSDKDRASISQQKSFTVENMDQASLLAKVIKGDHVPVLNITSQKAGGQIIQMEPVKQVVAPEVAEIELKEVHTISNDKSDTSPVPKINVKAFHEDKAEEPVKTAPEVKPKGNKVRLAFDTWLSNKTAENFEALLVAKKAAKKGWVPLGFTAKEIVMIEKKGKSK